MQDKWTVNENEFLGDSMPHAILSREGLYIGQATDPSVARLFAVAPELLKALEWIADMLAVDAIKDEPYSPKTLWEDTEWGRMARAAIAKAHGES